MTSDRNAEDLFAEFLARHDQGEPDALDALCRERPEHAEELRALHEEWLRVEGVFADLGGEGGPSIEFSGRGPGDSAWQAFLEQLRTRGPTWKRYEELGEIARGGMGVIRQVRDQDLRRNLAMKVVMPREDALAPGSTPRVDDRSLGRFLEEAQVTAQLDHPGIVPVHEVGIGSDGQVYFTMKLVRGEDLKRVFDRVHDPDDPTWNMPRALNTLLRACEAVAFAHDKGVIHRDLKPANVMVGRFGEVYVMDWGLARVLDREDQKDIRIRPASAEMRSVVASERRGSDSATPDEALLTMDGDIVGTPAYMPPEQAEGRVEELGPPADVYAMGAMLYHLLSGHMPYVPKGAKLSRRTVLGLVANGPPAPLSREAPDAPQPLVAICEKAMARDKARRYPDMTSLARDLRSYLEGRVVRAYETGAWAELKSWVRRNPALSGTAAAALFAMLSFSGWALRERHRARANEHVAIAKEREARDQEARADQNAAEAAERKAEFDQLAGVVLLRQLREREQELYPPWPDKARSMERWLLDWDKLEQLMTSVESTVQHLEARALPWTEEQRERDRRTHPRYQDFLRQQAKVETMRRAREVRSGGVNLRIPDLPDALRQANAKELNAYAWTRARPDDDGRIYGEEALALAAVRSALERFAAGDRSAPEYDLLDTESWALFALGLDQQAREARARASSSAAYRRPGDADTRKKYEEASHRLESAIDGFPAALAQAESLMESLAREVSRRRTWVFESESERFLHDTLAHLKEEVARFRHELVRSVEQRLAWALRLEDLTLHHPNARVTWEEAASAIARADGVVASSLYKDHPLVLEPQMGLVPIGMNPETRLWEFYHLRSACDVAGGEDPAEVEIPRHREDGSIEVRDSTGIVFVLIPGGRFLQGAQPDDPRGPNYDPDAEPGESPVHRVTLSPFFLARHELTQGQWSRLAGEEPSAFGPHHWSAAWAARDERIGVDHPVEQVSWTDADTWLRRSGLCLPSEAQWEYSARAGTSTRWGLDSVAQGLDAIANLADRYAKEHFGSYPGYDESLYDGNTVHARVGSYAPNPWGLFDMIGNVLEWCADPWVSYTEPCDGPAGLRRAPSATVDTRVARGGYYRGLPVDARVTSRLRFAPRFKDSGLGLRAARSLVP